MGGWPKKLVSTRTAAAALAIAMAAAGACAALWMLGRGRERPHAWPPEALSPEWAKLHLAVEGDPRVRVAGTEVPLTELAPYVRARSSSGGAEPKWTVYFPDRTDVDVALRLFGELAGCGKVAVYAEEPCGSWIERELGVVVRPEPPLTVLAKFREDYFKEFERFEGNHRHIDVLRAEVRIEELKTIVPKLLALSNDTHFRLQELGGLTGMPAGRYAAVLREMKALGVTSVSFCGVHLE